MQAFFKEKLKLSPVFLWIFLFAGLVPFAGFMIYVIINVSKSGANSDFSNEMLPLLLSLLIVIAVTILMVSSSLEFEIREGKIRYKAWPFVPKWRMIVPGEIASWTVKKINPIFYAGGWGYRRRFYKRRTAIVMRGNYGLELKLTSGRTLFLSTEEPVSLEREMKKLMEEGKEII
jgi:hypothetical protein